jgi:hypothetical protein
MNLPGVESAEVSLTKAAADIRLKPDNRITMAQLREALRKNGYPSRDARITARGRIDGRSGRPVFDLLNGSTMNLAGDPGGGAVSGETVEITGTSRADGKANETLTVAASTPAR